MVAKKVVKKTPVKAKPEPIKEVPKAKPESKKAPEPVVAPTFAGPVLTCECGKPVAEGQTAVCSEHIRRG